MRTPLVAGNWKMNGSVARARELAQEVLAGIDACPTVEVAVCPPYVLVPEVSGICRGTRLRLGAQDVSEYASGAYTGEVSAAMLNEYNCTFAIIGHSERRHILGETDERVAAKFRQAHRCGIVPIVCVGEILDERLADLTEAVVARQVDAIVEAAAPGELAATVIAYEPVWAIGTGQTASPDQAQAVHAFIRERIAARDDTAAGAMRILYGGSVKPDNAADLFGMPDIDGGLIGGASLQAPDFLRICAAARDAAAGDRRNE